jgi:D-3-phosphoglycerate dehydrogenase / 2-oxoglutarate reductase
MTYSVVYWNRATEDVYDVIRGQIPADWTLVTLKGETKAEWHAQIRDVDFMIVADWTIGPEDLDAAPKLRMVQHQGVGHERIDKQALKARGLPLGLCPAGTTIGVAEHTLLLILAVYKRLVVADTKMRQGTWLQWGLRATSFELCGKTLGLVGFGRIGQAVAKRAHAFDAKILYHDTCIPVPPAEAKAWGVESVSLDDLLRRSDIVSVHVPTTDETRKFMNAARFAQMKRSAVFINTSRGAVVDEAALIRALKNKVIAGAGLDVFEKEPIQSDNPLLTMDNVVLTPHISAGTVDALTEKMQAVFANMQRCLRGETIHDRVV